LIGRKEEKTNKKSTKLTNHPFSQHKQTNKQTNKREEKRQFDQTHPKDKSQSKITEQKPSETKEKLLKSQQINQINQT